MEAVLNLGRKYVLDAEVAARLEYVNGVSSVMLKADEQPRLALVSNARFRRRSEDTDRAFRPDDQHRRHDDAAHDDPAFPVGDSPRGQFIEDIGADQQNACDGEICCCPGDLIGPLHRSEEHTSELPSLMRISYAVFCLNKKKTK